MNPIGPPRDMGGGSGLQMYGGEPIATDYGHTLVVQDSSAAKGPCIWLWIREPEDPAVATAKLGDAHLTLEQVFALHAVLEQFIKDVPSRWDDGPRLLAEAQSAALGTDSIALEDRVPLVIYQEGVRTVIGQAEVVNVKITDPQAVRNLSRGAGEFSLEPEAEGS